MTQDEYERKLRELCAAVDNAIYSEELGETDYEKLVDRASALVDHIRSFKPKPSLNFELPRLYNFIDI